MASTHLDPLLLVGLKKRMRGAEGVNMFRKEGRLDNFSLTAIVTTELKSSSDWHVGGASLAISVMLEV